MLDFVNKVEILLTVCALVEGGLKISSCHFNSRLEVLSSGCMFRTFNNLTRPVDEAINNLI